MFASFESIFVDNNTLEILPNLCRHTRERKLARKWQAYKWQAYAFTKYWVFMWQEQ